jgi:hypothetical protein
MTPETLWRRSLLMLSLRTDRRGTGSLTANPFAIG